MSESTVKEREEQDSSKSAQWRRLFTDEELLLNPTINRRSKKRFKSMKKLKKKLALRSKLDIDSDQDIRMSGEDSSI